VTGEAPEMARVIAKALGIGRIEPRQVEWDSLIPGLNSGRFDVIGAGMYITPDRAANVAFTNPTYRIGEAFLVRSDNPKALHSYEDIAANEDATIGVVRGTVERDYARNAGIPDDRVVIFNDNDSALAGVRSGQVDAFAGTALTVQTLVDRVAADAGVERADPFVQPTDEHGNQVYGYGAFAFRQDEDDLVEAFNAAIYAFLGSDAHREMVAPFGFAEEELPGGLTTQEVLDLQ
ncbi:MAG: ectoine/hydroxyectoine ABC transporter substrate-binding protein EhuB, partial [Planctomycetota bacterium]